MGLHLHVFLSLGFCYKVLVYKILRVGLYNEVLLCISVVTVTMAYYLPRLYVSMYRKQEGPALLSLCVRILIALKFHSKYILLPVWNIIADCSNSCTYTL